MKAYKKWSPKERLQSLRKSKKAIEMGEIPPPTKCNRCGKTKGRIEYHNHNYSHPTQYLEAVCAPCHRMLHRRFKDPLLVAEYFETMWLRRFKENEYVSEEQPD